MHLVYEFLEGRFELRRVEAVVIGGHQHQGSLGNVVADGREAVHRVVHIAVGDGGGEVGQIHKTDGVAVGIGVKGGLERSGRPGVEIFSLAAIRSRTQ